MNTNINTMSDEAFAVRQAKRAARDAQIRADAELEARTWIEKAIASGPAKVRVQREEVWGAGKVIWVEIKHSSFEAWICLSGGKESRIWVWGGTFRYIRTKGLVREWIRSLGETTFASVEAAGALPAQPRLHMRRDTLFGSYPVGPEQVSELGAWVEMPLQ